MNTSKMKKTCTHHTHRTWRGRRGHDVHPVYRGDPWAAGTRAPAASADHSGHAPPAATQLQTS